jgi:hypothetical protein
MAHPSASFSLTLRVRLDDRPGSFADLARAIADAGGLLGAIDLVRVNPGVKTRDVSVLASDAAHAASPASRSSRSQTAPSCCIWAARSRWTPRCL